MPTHLYTIPLHEDEGVKPDSIFQRNVMPDSFFMLYLIPLYLIPLYLIPVYCYAWFQNQISLLCLIPSYHFLLYHIPLLCYNWFRYTSFCYAWFPLPMLCLIPLYHFPLCPSTLYQVPHPHKTFPNFEIFPPSTGRRSATMTTAPTPCRPSSARARTSRPSPWPTSSTGACSTMETQSPGTSRFKVIICWF